MSRIYHYHYCMERYTTGRLSRYDGVVTLTKPVYSFEDYRWLKAHILEAMKEDTSDVSSWVITSLSLHDSLREVPKPEDRIVGG